MKARLFERSEHNPILSPLDLEFPAAAVLNPGVAEYGGDVILLVRVENLAGSSSIYVARSHNGQTNWRVDPKPLLAYGQADMPYEQWGCEDARVTFLAEEDRWYITYTAYSPMGAAVALARTSDFVSVERLGLIFSPNNKDGVLFPQQFDGRWAVLHRPDAGGIEHTWSAYSPDLHHWGEPHCVLPESSGPAWDNVKVGAGPPPIPCRDGWLLIYHGVKAYGGHLVYRAGVALLDKYNPYKVVARCPDWVFQAEAPYEVSGLTPNVIFPTGILIRGDDLWMYYGAADTCICLATCRLDDLLSAMVGCEVPGI